MCNFINVTNYYTKYYQFFLKEPGARRRWWWRWWRRPVLLGWSFASAKLSLGTRSIITSFGFGTWFSRFASTWSSRSAAVFLASAINNLAFIFWASANCFSSTLNHFFLYLIYILITQKNNKHISIQKKREKRREEKREKRRKDV